MDFQIRDFEEHGQCTPEESDDDDWQPTPRHRELTIDPDGTTHLRTTAGEAGEHVPDGESTVDALIALAEGQTWL